MPSNTKFSAQTRYIRDRKSACLTVYQANYIYKKIETEKILSIDTIKQEVETDRLGKIDNNNGKINPYHEIIKNKVEKDDTIISQMKEWSILSNIVNYKQYDRHPKTIMI